MAFVARASYVLEQNGENPQSLDPMLPSHATALSTFRSALLNVSAWTVDASKEGDAMKWATPVTNVVHALDLYLALENAYEYWTMTTS